VCAMSVLIGIAVGILCLGLIAAWFDQRERARRPQPRYRPWAEVWPIVAREVFGGFVGWGIRTSRRKPKPVQPAEVIAFPRSPRGRPKVHSQ
jgi:hypothetical protein